MVDPEKDPDETTRGYDAMATDTDDGSGWESPWGDNPLQRYYSWPATRALLPDLTDRRVLDAGCGVGDHVGWLLDRGAAVVGIDASEPAVESCRRRYGDRADFGQIDLTEPLPFDDGAFDVVLSHLVLDHLSEWRPVFDEFRRVLTAEGTLVFAVVHPMQYYLSYDAVTEYYDTAAVELGWDDVSITSYHRPVSDVINALAESGFRLDRFEEPRPPTEYAERAADEWNVTERPQICVVRADSDQR
ncbi:class I SAM-dependent methyltransferase [Halostella sp. PRR32]|uniref:class I SAM-dependent methyltransferase n=1 Tax=Halostella sp. PRR32 TaxID=3098147 RepID=UPI002B1D7682|nr:class I SAM-dependent methyltransferase [Halostella sp. PRR32]